MSEPTILLRYADLQARGIVRNREQLRILIAEYNFPRGWMLTPNARVYDAQEVEAWLQSRREAAIPSPPQPGAKRRAEAARPSTQLL